MKALWQAISIVAVLHVLGAVGLLSYLAGTDRLNRERLVEVKETFEQTIAAEAEAEAEAEKLAQEAADYAERVDAASRDRAVLVSATNEIDQRRARNEFMLRRLERTRQEIESLKANLLHMQKNLEAEREALRTKQAAFEEQVQTQIEQLNDDGFQRSVQMYEQLPPKQAKQMFVELMDGGKTAEVVEYLQAMQPRKAAGVLREFKTQAEVTRAVELTERLRARGDDLADALESVG